MISSRLHPFTAIAVCVALLATALVAAGGRADASSDSILDVLVSQDPVGWTPNLTGDRVVAIDTANGVVAAGGLFTAAREPGSTDVLYDNLVLFEEETGTLLPAPSFDKEVLAVEAAADGQSFYIGGKFKQVNGETNKGLVRVGLDGQIISTWSANVDWRVNDIVLVGDVLYIGGNFNEVNGQPREGLAALDAATGALLPWHPVVADPKSTDRTSGYRSVDRMDASADGTRLVLIGNFGTIDGVQRDRVAMFDIAGGTPQLADWYANGFDAQCRASKWPQWIRDMDVSPAGDYVVFGTTGAYGSPTGSQRLCDTVSRYELHRTGEVEPTWLSYTGGDTTYGVAATGDVVYAGGHMRWFNNPYAADAEGPGAVERTGIAALDSRTGVPLDWNPVRDPRGFGTYELVADETGLWVGQDTGNIGGEYHGLIAKLPTAGGTAVPKPANGDAAAGAMLIGVGTSAELVDTDMSGPLGSSIGLSFDGAEVGAATTVGTDLLVARTDDTMELVADSGAGARTVLDLNRLASSDIFEVDRVTAMFHDPTTARLYYTLDGSATLRSRGYSAHSRVVEALAYTVSGSGDGFGWTDVTGAFLVGDTLYVGRSDGTLDAISWVDGAPVPGTMTTVGGPDINGVDHAVNALTLVGADVEVPNAAPVAAIEVTCDDLDCTVDAGGSYDPDGTIVSSSISLDGEVVASGQSALVTVPSEGTYTFSVTVTDDEGATASASTEASANGAPVASFTVSCSGLTCAFDGSASTDGATPGEGITTYAWDLGDGTVADTATVEHTYAGEGDVTVTLTVTDDEGGTTTSTQTFTVYVPVDGVTHLGTAADNRWTQTPSLLVPAEVRDGSVGVLTLAINNGSSFDTGPTGVGTWTQVGRTVDTGHEVVVFVGTLDAADAGGVVEFALTRGRKVDISLVVYGGVDTTDPVIAAASLGEEVETAEHVTPTVDTTEVGTVVSIWTDKTSDSTSWTAPVDEVVRHLGIGSGGGRVGVLVTDGGTSVPAGTHGGLTAVSGSVDDSATMWTLVLRPA